MSLKRRVFFFESSIVEIEFQIEQSMLDQLSSSNFDNYIAEIHERLDKLREIHDVDEQCAALVADLAQAYTEQPSSMQTAMCLSALFSGQRNIFTFLRRASSKIELKKTKLEILQFLKFFVETASNKILPYAVELKSVLLTIFNVDSASDVKAAIFPVLSQLMELSAGFPDMESEIDKMATTFLDQIGLQSSKTTATIKGLCLAFLGLLCKYFPEHMRKYADPLLIGQILKYLHEHLVRDVVKFEMLIAAGAMESLIYYLANFVPSATTIQPAPVQRGKSKEEEKRFREEQIRSESDLKRVYLYASRAIQTQDQTNLNRYALVKAGLELFAQHSTLFTEYLYEDYPEILRCLRFWNAHDNYDVKKIAQRAYDAFLLGVANALKEPNVKTAEQRRRAVFTFQYFIKEFRDKIDMPELEIRDLAMGIRGYGIFANACRLYGTEEDIKFMFVGLIQRCEQIAMPTLTLSQSADVFDERYYALPNLLDALSAIIIEMTVIGEEFLGPLERLTVMTIDYYPRYQPKPQATTCSSVIKMILALQTKPTSYKPFLSRIVSQALIRCCSHPLKSTVEQQLEDVEPNLPDEKGKALLSIGKTITYENYLPLWKNILAVTSLKEFDTNVYPIFDRQNMLVSFYDEIIESILHIIDRLDLSIDKQTDEKTEDDDSSTSDPIFGMKPNKPKDFQIFYNLVDFCQDLLLEQSADLFEKWIFRFLYDVISASTKYPLVSGFYRLATFVMKICLKMNYFQLDRKVTTIRSGTETMETDVNGPEQVNVVCALVRRFAHEVLARQKQYRDDLLISCLQFVISLPAECIDYDFADYLSAIQLSLNIGLTYLPLAEQTIESLERWAQSSLLNLSNFYDEILPNLDDFLRLSNDQTDDVNVRSIISSLQDSARSNTRTKSFLPTKILKKTKQIKHLFEETEIRRVQYRIVKYLGYLGNRTNHFLIDKTSNNLSKEAVAWDTENHLIFPIPMDEIRPTIELDRFLPRIVDLALHCSDRQTKITACELLQSIVLYMIGKSANQRTEIAGSYEKLYGRLFPAILELSCDSDTFTKTLFTTFLIQIIHWFTKNQNYENPETMSLLDTFMDGMISGKNASIRDFSGVCLKEFLRWTVKHCGGFDKPAYLKNATSVLKRLISFSLHPNSFKRLGSCLAWNSIYTLFRESEILVDVFTFELLYVFLESLAIAQTDDPSLGTQQQAIAAISHVQRILKEKCELFVKDSPKRHRPPAWSEATLNVAVSWLFRQCARIETESRRKSIELVSVLVPNLPGVRNLREFFEKKIQTEGFSYFIERFEGSRSIDRRNKFKATLAFRRSIKEMSEDFSISVIFQWLEVLISSLDCYTWAFSHGFLRPRLFRNEEPQSVLIDALSFFISKVSMNSLEDLIKEFAKSNETFVFTATDVKQFESGKCTVIVRLFNFISSLWSKFPEETISAIDRSFYTENLTNLVLTSVLNPIQLGFDINNEEIHQKLPERIKNLLQSMIKHLPDSILDSFREKSIDLIKDGGLYNLFDEFDRTPIRWSLIFSLARGQRLLNEVGILPKPAPNEKFSEKLWSKMLEKMISHDEQFDRSNFVLTFETQRALQSLFDYVIYLGIQPNEVLQYFFQSQRIHTDSGMTTVGTYLLTLFKHQITSWLGTTPDFIIENIGNIDKLDQCRSVVGFLSTVLDLCSREKQIRTKYGRQFVEGIYTCWPQFSFLHQSSQVDDKLLIVTLLTKTFIIDSQILLNHQEFQSISQIYLNLLVDKQLKLTFKIRLLDLLTFFASIENNKNLDEEKRNRFSGELRRSLRCFTADCLPLKSTEFAVGTSEYHDYHAAISKILSAMELSSSFLLFESIIWMLCCESQHCFEEEILSSISRYVVQLKDVQRQTNLLDYVYSIIFGKNPLFRSEHRLHALEKLILKILTSLPKRSLIEFYKKYVCALVVDEFDAKIDLQSNNLVSILINKVCAYRLIDYMYTILSKDDLFGLNSPIARVFYETIQKQDEARKILNVNPTSSTIKIGPIMDGKELTKHVIARARAQFVDGKLMKSMEFMFSGTTQNVEKQMKTYLVRCLATSSFNCLISLLICTQTEAKLYKAFIFDANPAKDEQVFENLIDPEHRYTFPLELERYYKKDKRTLLNVLCKKISSSNKIDSSSSQRTSTTPHYLSSQYLFGSSLSDELAVFDFTSAAANQQITESNSIVEQSTLKLSTKHNDDNQPTLIEGIDDELGSELIDMEMDELNLHPCMVPMVCLLKHMETSGIIPSVENGSLSQNSEMPPWMICLYKKFSDPLLCLNIKLFIMRLILHTHRIFKPYARYWLGPIIQLCNLMFENSSEGLNTFIIDTIVIALSWHTQAVPSDLDSIAVQRLVEYLFSNCSHRNPIIMKSNLDLIKKLVECWRERIRAPTLVLYKLIADVELKSKQNAVGLSLIGILLANEVLPYFNPTANVGNLPPVTTNSILTSLPADLTEDKFYDSILRNMKNTYRNIYAAAAEVAGMLLNVKRIQGESNQRIIEQINSILKWQLGQGLQDTYVTCVFSIQKHYPAIMEKSVMNKLVFGLKKMYGDLKVECLESLMANINEFDNAYLELKAAGILDILIHKDFGIRTVALRLIYKLLPKLTHEQLFEITQILSIDGPHDSQLWTLEIYKWLYDYIVAYLAKEMKQSLTPMTETFYHHVREQLLQLLASKNPMIRVNCRNFLADPKRLSISPQHRLLSLVDQFYSIKTERDYLNYCTNFLLERTTFSADYNRVLFEHPLDKCLFQEFPLVCHWRQRHHTYVTPLFTLQSQSTVDLNPNTTNTTTSLMTMNPIQFMQTLSEENPQQTSALLLQTQEISTRQKFLPTQASDGNSQNYDWLKQGNTLDSLNTFMLPSLSTQTRKTTSLIVDVEKSNKKNQISSNNQSQMSQTQNDDDDEIFRLKRRFLKDSGQLHASYFARRQNEKKENEKQFLNEIKLKQENHVEKYRTYRIGELPDIQIRSSDIIIPLQALAQYDNHIARLLYAQLFSSILNCLQEKLSPNEYRTLIQTIQYRFDAMLSQSEIFHPAFVAAILDIILSNADQLTISAEYISASTIASHLESVGILTIERLILLNRSNSNGPTKKKFKSDPELSSLIYKQTDQWLELAKCYRSLANYEDVRGIFSQTAGLKPITLRAVEEESRSDYLQALNSYITALEQNQLNDEDEQDPANSILELEQEFWTQSMLNCCNQLNNWTLMSKQIFIENTTFDTLWSNAHQLNYLMPYAIRSKLKLLISGNEQEQADQNDLCQFFNNLSSTSNNNSNSKLVMTSGVETTFVKRSYIEQQYPFELATFFLYQKDFDRSKYYIQFAKDQFLLRWSTLSRLSEYGRKTTVQLIQPYYELDQFLQFIEHNLPLIRNLENRYLTNNKHDTNTSKTFFDRLQRNLLSQWQLPDAVRSSIQIWDDIVTNRSLFLDVLDDLLGGPRMSFTSKLKTKEFDPILVDYKVQSSLDMAFCALRQRNFKLALTKLNETRSRLDSCQNPLMKSIFWNEIYCEVHLKRHQSSSSTSTLPSLLSTLVAKELKKMENKIQSLDIVDRQAAELNSTYIQLNAQFCRTVIDFLLIQPNSYSIYENDEKLPPAKRRQLEFYLSKEEVQQTEILIENLFNKCLSTLTENIDKIDKSSAKETILSRDYNELASICDEYLRRFENNEDEHKLLQYLFRDENGRKTAELIVESVLLSMRYGSSHGVKRFSRLLQIIEIYPSATLIIEKHLQQIPCWLFFDCLYQITAHLDKPIATTLYPLIEQIVQLYPQAIVYPFKLSYEKLQTSVSDPVLKNNIQQINEKLNRSIPLVNDFIAALNDLNPHQQFDSWSKDFVQLFTVDQSQRDVDKVLSYIKEFKSKFFQESNIDEFDSSSNNSIKVCFKNSVEKDFNEVFGGDGELVGNISLGDVRLALGNLSLKLKTVIHNKNNINEYSSWFSSTFRQQTRLIDKTSTRELEIPGQYTSKRKPLLEHHIKIVGFDEKLLVLHSLRLPKRITIRGHDENDYRFLIKAGEDIRQDQRIEALFSIMNDLYDNDPNCNQSNSGHITVRTYKVIPLSSKLGMIEWLDNTRPLKDLIEESYKDDEVDRMNNQGQHPRKLYQDYVTNAYQKAKPNVKIANNTQIYAELFLSLTKAQVEEEFRYIQSLIPIDLLRRAYYKLANSHEGFYTLRREFINSYAILCTSQYILGIGDRHQSNFLIDTSSGQVIGIDFGSAFNAATIHLPVPELIPIRLTRQLLEMMSPIGSSGLFRSTMIHTMNALRENSDLLLSTMDVFIKEPLIEWMEHALKTSKQVAITDTEQIHIDETYAKDRIKSARLKLNGINPAVIMAADLKLNNFLRSSNLKDARRQMERVVGGDQIDAKRAHIFLKYTSNRYQKLSVEEQIDCIIDQATDVDILGRSWAGLETFM